VDYEVILTEPARDDLREIVAFIAQDNPQAAITFRDRLIAEAETGSLSSSRRAHAATGKCS
jgi:plasmid stabilization system protein ParE